MLSHLPVAFQMLSDGDSFLDQEVQILWNGWCKTLGLQDAQDFVSRDGANLSDTMRISENNTWMIKTRDNFMKGPELENSKDKQRASTLKYLIKFVHFQWYRQ